MNLYAYVGNDPMNNTDPDGQYICTGNRAQCTALRQALARLDEASRSRNLSRSDRAWAARIHGAYGREGQRNGIVVRFLPQREMARISRGAAFTVYNPRTRESLITLPATYAGAYDNYAEERRSVGDNNPMNRRVSGQDQRGNMVADEGKHAMDQQRLGRQLRPSEWHPRGQDFRSLVSRAFGTISIQDLHGDDD